MTCSWIDIGVNLTDKRFADQQAELVETARAAGVGPLIVTGTDARSSEMALALCRQIDGLYCTAGVHPHDAKQVTNETLTALRQLCQADEVIAVGETGLDFNRNFSPPEQQVRVFEAQLELAAECGLPLFLHERDAHQRQLEMLTSHRDQLHGGVAHCFTGSKRELFNYLDLDLYIGITGWVCDERRGDELRRLIPHIPLDRLLLETDAPYLLPRDLRPKPKGGRNEPRFLPHIAAAVAALQNNPLEELQQACFENTQRLFRLPL
ncbi:TatD family hydrolase [Marinobacterium arenosum]|uniref:TatD family hydrolase n=1 Tax=Marinobacterium arenosum TaxID=2862496 RepID=UPI001C973545|nr:TatD family hydrolase [Marinobacterium arenosum]MBY4676923.1 TatD family hydrolase [Marinobacterium arenosum]